MREVLLSECIKILYENNFIISKPTLDRSCFDLIARKGNTRLLIKVLKNIDSLSSEQSQELYKIASIVSATPLIIGSRTRNSLMEDEVVYERHHIKAITPKTFKNQIAGRPPVVYADRGGFFVNIDGNVLKRTREQLNISVGELAEISRVSRKTIYKYEQNEANPSAEVAIKIEEYLDVPLVKGLHIIREDSEKINIKVNNVEKIEKIEMEKREINNKKQIPLNSTVAEEEGFKSNVLDLFKDLGFNITETTKAPFDALGEDKENSKNLLFTNIQESSNEEVKRKALLVNEISKLFNSHSILILENKDMQYKRIAALSLKELEQMGDTEELLNFLKEKNKN
ncbi:transcriptional regulator [Methanococcus voltae]|uniref:Putative HTH-type transcriptional regulatory protein Mvol_0629 n=1 Tax=Methanococcus voltae (strain ATCC BAA-1334 / A3) TaxID=456320 RepID=D7DT28_METV3|nr:transcriptional regulator [Methanococcus voltae]MCS3901936.1 putative transcriptional regulator [Methanococcus voltae]